MKVRVIDLDGSILAQGGLVARHLASVVPVAEWGPHIRMACAFGRFRKFERVVAGLVGDTHDREPWLTLFGSGDFHHVSLALVRRLSEPFNLLVLDNHPDWMRGVPFLHCGTWLYHAAKLPLVRRVFHVGGDVDFDNYYRPMAPWRALREGRIVVIPALQRYRRGGWRDIRNYPLLGTNSESVVERVQQLMAPYRTELGELPLYISLDKDVLTARDAVVNWDSGHLRPTDVRAVLAAFIGASRGRLAGMDIVGDWSPVRLCGTLRRVMHWSMHPALKIDPGHASRHNEELNLSLVEEVRALLESARPSPELRAG
jgi:hypothetical protein